MDEDQTKPHVVTREKQNAVVIREKVRMDQLQQFFGRAFSQTISAAQSQSRQLIGPPFAFISECRPTPLMSSRDSR